ncbi:RecF/RecN/SMC [Ochromonadaceae sp. CCMP2298]|nr:RecF/RecN/SMC [Ochromonadaceae sp. CCMP2298]|mmetsp:Transcript_16539/g.36664  ORF Transcript_16539/g.36664 Transcript_16539/m.36664 type:complete len:1221 (+) Transcript_16539:91-3753(+)
MYIQEIILDGFKSYAQKTVVSGFDPQFNAITGLNGTGKSNILDSICFVLGISNLTQVRVGNLQELVYKQGQAGVTKASVTIIFNNSDVASSPVGYEQHKQITVTRQVVIGGKNKYMINGHTVQQNQVQNMFHSVQLNVNNPHFLIMQGRITKVLNMKPQETLSMIEEAAGTRMFETKKQAAVKTIEKKQLKVEEITKCINEEITPTLENLRNERKDYHTWQSNNTEFERLERFCVAHEYQSVQDKVASADADRQKLTDEQEELEARQAECGKNASVCAQKIGEIERMRGDEMEGELAGLKKIETDLSKDLVKISTLHSNQKESLTAEEEQLATLLRQCDQATASLAEKQAELQTCEGLLRDSEGLTAAAEETYTSLRDKYQNACAGVTDETSAELLSLPEQIGVWEKKERETQSTMQQCQQKATYATKQLKDLQKTSSSQTADHASILREADALKAKIAQCEKQIADVRRGDKALAGLDEGALRTQAAALHSSVAGLRDQVEQLTAQLEARLTFEFRDPEKNFDRTRVKGLVARLVTVNKAEAATALEIAAGAKLYQVVVDTENTGKLLLQKGGLRKRVTILPLNKINSRCTDPTKVSRAKQMAKGMGGSAQLALELVGYDAELTRAMEYVFGNAIVCDTSAIAKAIAFDKNIKTRTVTLEGDTYDPSGTLTGGSKNSLGQLLGKIEAVQCAQVALRAQEEQLGAIRGQLGALEKQANSLKDVSHDLEMKTHALTICNEKMADSSYQQSLNQVAELQVQLGEIEKETQGAKDMHKRAKEELAKLQGVASSSKKNREKVLKDMEKGVKDAQKAANAVKAELLKLKNKRDVVLAEIKACRAELNTIGEQRQICEAAGVRLAREVETLVTQVGKIRAAFDDAKSATGAKTQELNRCSREIKELQREKDGHLKEAQAASLQARKVTHALAEWDKASRGNANTLQGMLKSHPWIEKEKTFFGQVGSDFDFAAKDVVQCSKRHAQLKTDQDRLAKNINKKVMGMIENAETEYEELNRKREVILNDKSKIEAVISELDVKKAQALQVTWTKVNKDFGSIFSMLLPGVTAKLEPPEGCDVSEGLEVKVAFNNIWKDSLTELSGGQRSLLALSLILALLLFKPAPMYILDEVDAALDLSHTQNIGMMLRTHFSTSQFIVVSLKEGMFNNANVIYRTRFVDGISAVQRTVAGKGRVQTAIMPAEEEEDAPKKKKGKASKNTTQGASAVEL